MVDKGTWVCIRRSVLSSQERAAGLPEDTMRTPLMLWVNGALLDGAQPGDDVTVRTRTGRVERGVLEEVMPQYNVSYGEFAPELQDIGTQARDILFGGDKNV